MSNVHLPWVNPWLEWLAQFCNSVLNVKVLVGAFNQEKAQVGLLCDCETDGLFAALILTLHSVQSFTCSAQPSQTSAGWWRAARCSVCMHTRD